MKVSINESVTLGMDINGYSRAIVPGLNVKAIQGRIKKSPEIAVHFIFCLHGLFSEYFRLFYTPMSVNMCTNL